MYSLLSQSICTYRNVSKIGWLCNGWYNYTTQVMACLKIKYIWGRLRCWVGSALKCSIYTATRSLFLHIKSISELIQVWASSSLAQTLYLWKSYFCFLRFILRHWSLMLLPNFYVTGKHVNQYCLFYLMSLTFQTHLMGGITENLLTQSYFSVVQPLLE